MRGLSVPYLLQRYRDFNWALKKGCLLRKPFIQNLFNNPQEGINWVNKTFNSLKDASGTIPRATFGPKIKAIAMGLGAPEPNEQSLEAAVAAADPDSDGKITYDEFKNFCVEAGDGLLVLLGL